MNTNSFKSSFEQKLGYIVYTPDCYDKQKKYPLIVALHGAGERGNGEDELIFTQNIGLGRYFKEGLMDIPCVVLTPQCPCGRVWNQMVFILKDLIDKVISDYNIDEDRVSITGMSMGGFGTWEMGMTFPDMFSCMAPICGGGMAWKTDALNKMPIWAFHGDADTTVNINQSYDMVNGARKNGADVKFTIFNNVGHNSWDPAYLDTCVVDWLVSHNRKDK